MTTPANEVLKLIALGVVEGITEFLPISSTGHLLIAEQLGLGARSELFNIVIQAGAILAVTLLYWRRLLFLATGLREPPERTYTLKLTVAFLVTSLLGLLAKKLGFELPDQIAPIAWALILGGVAMLGAEWLVARQSPREEVTWLSAVMVGIAQVLAGVFPGASRSATTIFAAMLSGTRDRSAATEFSFLVGIPTMYAASAYALIKEAHAGEMHEGWTEIAIGFVTSAITAFLVVRWLLRYIRAHSFRAFAVYRIAFGAVLLWFFAH